MANPDDPGDLETILALVRSADGMIWTPGLAQLDHPALVPPALATTAPHATVMAITPFGLTSSWSTRPASEATIQALSGSAGWRGSVDTPPLICGGLLGEWQTGMVAALAYLISRHRRLGTGVGELVDVSALETNCLTNVMYPVTFVDMAGQSMRPVRMSNVPGIHPAADGWVGFMLVTGQQWLDFTVMVERPDWAEDPALARLATRSERSTELVPHIDAWTRVRTAAEICDFADALRIPVAALGNGATLPVPSTSSSGTGSSSTPAADSSNPTCPTRWVDQPNERGPVCASAGQPHRRMVVVRAHRGGRSGTGDAPGGTAVQRTTRVGLHEQLGGAHHRPRVRDVRRRRDQGGVGHPPRSPPVQHDQGAR